MGTVARTLCARSAIAESASAESTASNSAQSSGDSEIPPEQTASFRSERACPDRISARTSALMGISGGYFQIISRELDASRQSLLRKGTDWMTVQLEHHRAGIARSNVKRVVRLELPFVACVDRPFKNGRSVGRDRYVDGLTCSPREFNVIS